MRIHKEGFKTILLVFAIIALLVGFIICQLEIPFWLQVLLISSGILFIFLIAMFFRVPVRKADYSDHKIYSGADGKVVVIEEVFEDEFFKDKRLQVSVFMSVANVHVNFAPLGGVVSYFKYHPGKHLVAWLPKSSVENERTSLVIDNPETGPVLIRQIAGAFARRIVCYPREGQTVDQGSEIGIIKFGSRVDIFLPLHAEVKVQANQHVKGGESLIATIQPSF